MRSKLLAIAVSLRFLIGSFSERILGCLKRAFPKALKTSFWILKITLPVSLLVSVLSYFGLLNAISVFLTPVFKLIGLRGEAAIAFVTGVFLNIYSVIAVLSQLTLTLREVTIIAVMSLIAHNLIVETAVQSQTGSKAWHMVILRLGMAFVAAFLLNLTLPPLDQVLGHTVNHDQTQSLYVHLHGWLFSAFRMIFKIIVLIFLLMVLQEMLREFNLIEVLTAPVSPVIRFLGLPQSTTFLWIIANTLGLAYGSAVMLDEVSQGRIRKAESDLLNYHIAISHSNLEDLLLFAALGVSISWMLGIRLIIAALAVWARRWYLSAKGEVFI
ncbi:MAG: nucleoside recognition domain-containing protein [Tenuifilum sp.]|uniref:nucleoside recognition domain-containing protein n=1 Tax=Tenuifilum sp. TaxID=2760880 RepID=UPI003C998A96